VRWWMYVWLRFTGFVQKLELLRSLAKQLRDVLQLAKNCTAPYTFVEVTLEEMVPRQGVFVRLERRDRVRISRRGPHEGG
jgi:hypothetical protein